MSGVTLILRTELSNPLKRRFKGQTEKFIWHVQPKCLPVAKTKRYLWCTSTIKNWWCGRAVSWQVWGGLWWVFLCTVLQRWWWGQWCKPTPGGTRWSLLGTFQEQWLMPPCSRGLPRSGITTEQQDCGLWWWSHWRLKALLQAGTCTCCCAGLWGLFLKMHIHFKGYNLLWHFHFSFLAGGGAADKLKSKCNPNNCLQFSLLGYLWGRDSVHVAAHKCFWMLNLTPVNPDSICQMVKTSSWLTNRRAVGL